MRPQHFKFPFTWEERRPLIVDRVLFIPKYYENHREWSMPAWEDPQIFGRQAPVHIEYCSGNGAWIVEKALKHPEIHFVAVEKRFERVRKLWSKMHNLKLSNLFVVCGEALTFTQNYLSSESIEKIFVNFPDPWPKRRLCTSQPQPIEVGSLASDTASA